MHAVITMALILNRTTTCCHVLTLILSLFLCSPSCGLGDESISINENSPTYVNISWGIEAGAAWGYYSVDVITTRGNSVNGYPTNTTDMSHRITGLRPDTEYTVTVTPWSSEVRGDSLNKTVATEAIAEGQILVSDVTSSSAFLQWKPVDGVAAFTIVAEPSDALEAGGALFDPEVSLTILLPGTVFNVTVRGGIPVMNLASTLIRSAPEAVVDLSLQRTCTHNATISWTPPSSPHDGYEFYVIKNSTNQRSLVATVHRDDVSSYEMTLTGLSPSTIYSFEVGTVLNARDSFDLQRSDQDGNPSVLTRTTDAIAEGEILVSDVTSSSAFLQWQPVDGVVAYTIVVEPSGAIEEGGAISEAEVSLTILLPGTVFNVTVQRGGMDLASTQIRSAPGSVVNISLERTCTYNATISWTRPSSPHDGYEFFVINNSTNQRSLVTNVQRDDVSSYEMTLTGLSPATIYSFEVGTVLNARDSFDLQRSDQDGNPSVLGRTAPGAVVNISLERTCTYNATISWTRPSSPHDGYEFFVINNSTNQRSLVTNVQRDDVSSYEMTLTGLSPAAIYSFEVGTVLNARDSFDLQRSDQDGNPSVLGRTEPEAPVSMIVTTVEEDYVNVTLTPPTSRHDAYEIYLSNSTTNQKTRIKTVQREDDMSYDWTVSDLSPSTNYSVEVGTVLDAEGLFPLQRSVENPMASFETGPPQTGDAFVPTLHCMLFLVPLLALFMA